MSKQPKLKALVKAVSYRLLGSVETFLVAYCLTGEARAAGVMMGFQAVSHIGLYFVHECAWDWVCK